jgi:CRISPR-associated endonuclease/helicase Cas3
MSKPIAHVRQTENGQFVTHDLADHLRDVAGLAREFAEAFGSGEWAYLAGIWHDLGKYRPAFQRYIREASGYDRENAHIEGSKTGRVDHSSAGALYALEILGPPGRALAYLIAGHHAGLPDWDSAEAGGGALSVRIKQRELMEDALRANPPQEILRQSKPTARPPGGAIHLWLRMLFSCLADADFLDTEEFMESEKTAQRANYPELSELLAALDRHLAKFAEAESTNVNCIRADVLRQCRERAADKPGLFSLTVPTGGGKTLSSLAFALNHAILQKKRRVIYAIPYTSIIEQTASVFREVFEGLEPNPVIEHHSNLDPDREDSQSRLAAENWDAPLIVTTNVQLFESLFAARTSRCRKLHNLVNSVIVLDEAQLLPPEFLDPILDVLRDLTAYYDVTVVLCTATQPALKPREGFGWKFEGLPDVREIMDCPLALYHDLKRVEMHPPADWKTPTTWEELAWRIKRHPTALAIVNRRNDARELAGLLPEAVHLSANLCGEHRSALIGEIKERLNAGKPVQVVSTQLIEAGVDVDFPVVFRALAGLDSIAQAAGRCNREGRLRDGIGQPRHGEIHVFIPPKPSPPGLLLKGEQAAKELLDGFDGDPLTPELFERYFELYYGSLNSRDQEGIYDLLRRDERLCQFQFRTAAQRFKLIDEEERRAVVVRYGESEKWLNTLNKKGPDRWLMRKLQRYAVNIPVYDFERLKQRTEIVEIHGVWVQAVDGLYHGRFGWVGSDDVVPLDPGSLII